jgi:hypothetical protein
MFFLVFNQIHVRKYVQWIKQLNLFKMANKRTENNTKQQKIITRIYLILVIGMIISTAVADNSIRK